MILGQKLTLNHSSLVNEWDRGEETKVLNDDLQEIKCRV
jgi:hypothetical protein